MFEAFLLHGEGSFVSRCIKSSQVVTFQFNFEQFVLPKALSSTSLVKKKKRIDHGVNSQRSSSSCTRFQNPQSWHQASQRSTSCAPLQMRTLPTHPRLRFFNFTVTWFRRACGKFASKSLPLSETFMDSHDWDFQMFGFPSFYDSL